MSIFFSIFSLLMGFLLSLISNTYVIIFFILIICIIICSISFFNKKDKFFYEITEISYELKKIHKVRNEVYNEATDIYFKNKNWINWPEKDLYANNGSWEIFPFYAFGTWVENNCEQCPKIYNFLKSIDGLKLATLSKLSSGMKLKHHRGWGKHSNHVIRCHYGLIVPSGCYISVSDENIPPLYNQSKKDKFSKYPNNIRYNEDDEKEEIRFHKKFEWMAFDDSKTHYAENMSDKDRIVLIIDIERPRNIKTGTSLVGDTKELKEIIKYYKQNNINIKKNDPYKINIKSKSNDINNHIMLNDDPMLENEIENPAGISKDLVNKILYGE